MKVYTRSFLLFLILSAVATGILVMTTDVSVCASGLCIEPSFRAARRFRAGNVSVAVVAADFNHDQKTDLAVGNRESNDISILLGNGNGGFSAPTNFALPGTFTDNGPNDIAVADLNNDGNLDLVIGTLYGVSFFVILGDGTGGFAAPAAIQPGLHPFTVSVADFNKDGANDIAVSGGNGVAVYTGDGSAHFTETNNFSFPNTVVESLTGDFNSDSNPDLVLVDKFGDRVWLMLGDGVGNFSQVSSFLAGDNPLSICSGDFNNDGKLDLATANEMPPGVSLFINDGNGGFNPAIVQGASVAFSISAADFNGDNNQDLATAEDGGVLVRFGNGSGSFPTSSRYSVGEDPVALVAGQLNGDTNPDLGIGNIHSGVSVLLSNGSGDFNGGSFINTGEISFAVATGDINKDGKLDLIAPEGSNGGPPGGQVSVSLGDGQGGFGSRAVFAVGMAPRSLIVLDFNRDGNPDVATANADSNSATVLLGDGTGSFTTREDYGVGQSPHCVATEDFNKDGNPDLVTANTSSQSLSILLGNGVGGILQQNTLPVPFAVSPLWVAVADFNNDSNPDVATTSGLLLGDGMGNFTPSNGPYPHTQSHFGTTADFNGDNNADLAVVEANVSIVSVVLGDGQGGFVTSFLYSLLELNKAGPIYITAAEVNGDHQLDVVTVAPFIGANVFLGDGTGNFGSPRNYAAGQNTSVAVGDLNQDGKTDLVIPSISYRGLVILFNTCAPNTGAGNNVTIQFEAAALTFTNITHAGNTTLTPIDPSTIGDVPGGFAVAGSLAYQISTTASFTGPVTLAFRVPAPISLSDFNNLSIFHNENGVLVDVTAAAPARDYANLTIYAVTNSFSPFYLVRRGRHLKPLFDQTKSYKRGSTVPIKVQILDSANTNISSANLALSARTLMQIGGNTANPVVDSGNANPDYNFRYDSSLGGTGGGYIFNLSTKGLSAGTYVLSLYADADHSFFHTVKFEVK